MPDEMSVAVEPITAPTIDYAVDFDLRRPYVRARLAERIAGGGYVVPDVALVRAIRVAHERGDDAARDALFELLVIRCRPMFIRYASGLRHRPELREDAIADMIEQLWKEILNPKERFIEMNFAYYLKCLCVDNFKRVLRNEGFGYRVNEQGQVIGRPERVPAGIIDHLDHPQRAGEDDAAADIIPDTKDPLEQRLASLEVERILNRLPDPLDRQIVTLRVFGQLKWDEIAHLCNKSERTMRTRFEDARKQMAQVVRAGDTPEPQPPTAQGHSKEARGRKKGTSRV